VERLGAPVQYEKTPLQVLMRQEKGHLILGAAGSREKGYVELSLIRESGRWQVEKWEVNRTPSGRGFSYSH
jgi:hypothetical protein